MPTRLSPRNTRHRLRNVFVDRNANENAETDDELHPYPRTNANRFRLYNIDYAFPRRVTQKLFQMTDSREHLLGIGIYDVAVMNEQYVRWIRLYERDPRRASIMNALRDTILHLLIEWHGEGMFVGRHSEDVGTTRNVVRHQINVIYEMVQLSRHRTVDPDQKYKETAYLVPFLTQVMSRYAIVRQFHRLLPRYRANETYGDRLERFIEVHAVVAEQIRQLKRVRREVAQAQRQGRPRTGNQDRPRRRRGGLPLPDWNANDGDVHLPAEPRPNWVNAIAEVEVPRPASNDGNAPNEGPVNLTTMEPMVRGVRLTCGHWISKDTLRGMVRTGRTLACPFCRELILPERLL